MSKDGVSYPEAKVLFPAISKSASFNSDKFAVNNNENVQIELHTISSISLACTAKIQGSLDGSSWLTLDSTTATITGDDDILWSLSDVDALMHLRVAVTRTAGSAIFTINYRGA